MINNNQKKIKENKINLYKIKRNKIISILGINSKSKINTTLNIAKKIKINKKILIINMDLLSDFFEKEFSEKINNKINLNINGKLIKKMKNRNIYYLDGREIIFKENNFFNFINLLKEKFDFLIINTSYECFLNYNKKLVEESIKNYFIIQNDEEYNKSINLLKIYKNKWKIPENKIEILINSNKEEFND